MMELLVLKLQYGNMFIYPLRSFSSFLYIKKRGHCYFTVYEQILLVPASSLSLKQSPGGLTPSYHWAAVLFLQTLVSGLVFSPGLLNSSWSHQIDNIYQMGRQFVMIIKQWMDLKKCKKGQY